MADLYFFRSLRTQAIRLILKVATFGVLVMSAKVVQAKEATVFDVRRPIPMENGETPEKDYFINAGENDGLKRGMLVMVNRRQALYDQYQNKSPGDLVVIVGQLRIIHVQGEISVARLEKLMSRDNMPTLDFDAVMMGDKVDLNTAKMAPQKTASIETPLPQETVIPAAPQIVPTVVPSVPALAPAGKAEFSSMAPQAPVPSGTSL